MKNLKAVREIEIKRPPRAKLSEKEVIKRMETIDEQREKLLATARKSKNGNLPS
ncbi:MAG: hypothetical protein M3525_15550 [Acidobacteriota bacterium]|nr:hypothetical protein [Acidobacteriota bacterium]